MDQNIFKEIKIFDGGMGQELLSKGLISKGTLWSASALIEKKFHKLVIDAHISYINAGADIIVSNNFSARKIRFIQNKVLDKFQYANEQAGILANKAREISKQNILIAGSLPSQSDTYVEDERSSSEIQSDFEEQAKIISPYVDFFYLDVVSSGREIEIASNIVEKLGKKVVVGMHLKKNCKLPSGESVQNIIEKFKCNNWIGLVFACVSPEIVELSIPILKKQKLPFGYKMNLFKRLPTSDQKTFNTEGFEGQAEYEDPVELLGTREQEYGLKEYKNFVSNSIKEGATLIGGCCEVKPRHIEALSSLF